ncbi:MAG: uracil-DNA glycosylase [Actinobacteria bacterium]|nr:uracil-DNA glycosylase [Actinomycetota bacterium]
MTTDWNPLLRAEFGEPYWAELQHFVTSERAQHTVYPPVPEVFAALHTTAHADVRVVILGQDPYHGPGQAHGLCFSVRAGVAVPPSLRNIFTELRDDLGHAPAAGIGTGVVTETSGDLTSWARQGVLLLNTTLTVRAGQAGSHQGKGWETFTDRVIGVVAAKEEPVVFVLWGAHARKKKALIGAGHTVVEGPHPSPLSAHTGFFGSRPFSRINEALVAAGRGEIDWRITGP